jgi:transcriptional antiterminator NusG
MELDYKFFAIQTTSGHENKVRGLIERKIEEDPRPEAERLVRQALVPTQEIAEIKDGKKVIVERRVFPSYVLVEMVLNQETMHLINSVQGVIKFVGKGWEPQPLRPAEVNRILGVEDGSAKSGKTEDIPFLVGQVVEITEGPFTDFNGTVEEVMSDKGKVRVSVSLFGRPTTVELDYLQLRGQ